MLRPNVRSIVSAVIAVASLCSFVAPFVLSPDLAAPTKNFLFHAPWIFVGVALLFVVWLALSQNALYIFFGFAKSEPLSMQSAGPVLSFALYGVSGLLRERLSSSVHETHSSLTPLRAVLLCASVGFIGTLAADGLIQFFSGRLIMPPLALSNWRLLLPAVLLFVVLSPIIETVVMALILEGFTRAGLSGTWSALLSAAVWSIWHAYVNHPAQAPSIFWLFWVLSTLYCISRSSMTRARSGLLAASAHAINNVLALAFIVAKQTILA